MTEDTFAKISKLRQHIVLCGAGRTGFGIIERLHELGQSFVLIENNPDVLANVQSKFPPPLPFVEGDATEDETLLQAGIQQASGLITALSEDKDNLFTILTARSLNPNLRIVTRVVDERHNLEKLKKAGADRVISTSVIGGMRIASEMIRPEVVKFLDQMLNVTEKEKTLRFTELPLSQITTPELVALLERSTMAETHLRIRDIGRYTGLLVVAIKSPGVSSDGPHNIYQMRKKYRFTPRGDAELHPDDVLVVIGTQNKLDEVTGQNNSQTDALDT